MDDKFNIPYMRDLEYFIKYNIDQLKLEYIPKIIMERKYSQDTTGRYHRYKYVLKVYTLSQIYDDIMSELFYPDVVKYNHKKTASHKFQLGDWVISYDERYQRFLVYFDTVSQYMILDKNLDIWYVSFELLFQRKNTRWTTFFFQGELGDYQEELGDFIPKSIRGLLNDADDMYGKDFIRTDKRIFNEYFSGMKIVELLQEDELISLKCIQDNRLFMLGLNTTVDQTPLSNYPFKWFISLFKLNAR